MTTRDDIETLNARFYRLCAERKIVPPIGPGNPATPKQVAA